MGMYSTFESEDIDVIDMEGLKTYIAQMRKAMGDNEMYDIVVNDIVTFEGWTDWKIISYWYVDMCVFLRGLYKYIRGEVTWSFENSDQAGFVEFTEKGTIIHTGQMQWQENKPDLFINPERVHIRYEGNDKKWDKIKELLLLQDI
jgi:hypothetical protein